MKTAEEIFNYHSMKALGAISPSKNFCLQAMEEYAQQFVQHNPIQLCPKCNGQGLVSKPPYIAGDVNQWTSSDTQFKCNLCDGKMTIPQFV